MMPCRRDDVKVLMTFEMLLKLFILGEEDGLSAEEKRCNLYQ